MTAPALRRFFHAAVAHFETGVDWVEDVLARGEGHGERVRIVAYAGYRNATRLRLRGRILRYDDVTSSGEGTLARLVATIAIYDSAEIADVAVRIEGYGQSAQAVSDGEGYFHFDLPIDEPMPNATRWESVTLSAPGRIAQGASVPAPVLAAGSDGHWGVISDIDDTVIQTGITNLGANWRRLLIERPTERLAVPGAASLFRAIARDHAAPARPFFYVSGSPWNLYGFIAEFMEANSIPHGPMFLKDWGIDADTLGMDSHEDHKLAAIREIMAFHPSFRFLLVGDNGERDVDIYAAAVADFETRIAGVFIRDTTGACGRGEKAHGLRAIEAAGVPTFCGEGFDDAVAVFTALELDRPIEAAKAVARPGNDG